MSILLCGLIRDIQLILVQPDLGHAAKLGAITATVDQLAPPPGPQTSAASAAAAVAALLARGTGPATALFEELAGEQLHIELTGRTDRPLTTAECHELRTAPGTYGHQRTGTLRTASSGLVAAEVSSLVVPGRLPPSILVTLGIPGPDNRAPELSALPLGKVLATLGVHREPLGARLLRDGTRSPGSRTCVESTARMWVDGAPVALASERVTAELCHRARPRLAGTRDTTIPEPRDSLTTGLPDCVGAGRLRGFGRPPGTHLASSASPGAAADDWE